jgi:hypothetical protein
MTNEEDDDMITNAIDPLILEIYLYKNNYKDRILISELKEKAQVVRIPNQETSSFFVRVEDVVDVLHDSFGKDLKEFEGTSQKALVQNVTSVYFIDNMIKSFEHLKYFKVNVSDSQVYSRLQKDTITFDYKVIHSRINFPSFCTEEFLQKCKEIFSKIGLYKTGVFERSPYFETTAIDLIDRLVRYSQEITDGEEMVYVDNILMLLGTKIEKDNPIVLVIVES